MSRQSMEPNEPADPRSASGTLVVWVRWGSLLAIVASVVIILGSLPLENAAAAIKQWVARLGAWGPIMLALLYIVATIVFVPGTILTLIAGAVYGLGIGMVVVSAGSTIGAAFAFLIARYVARDSVRKMAQNNRRFEAIDRAIGEGGWKIVALLRLSPAIPFNLQNYLYGLTSIRFWPYLITSWAAMLPGTFLYVYLGHVTGAAVSDERDRTIWEWSFLAVGLIATVVVTGYITRLTRSRLQDQIDDTDARAKTVLASDSADAQAPPDRKTATKLAAAAGVLVVLAAVVYLRADLIDAWVSELMDP